MYYLNSKNIEAIERNWDELAEVIKDAVYCLSKNEFVQPVKPYLRFGNLRNRIIAMPAYIGGAFNLAGIKWIASFPGNIEKNINRAQSITILNCAETGVPICVINTSLISAVRTAAVTALVVLKYIQDKPGQQKFVIGMCGFGPIGQLHLEMIASILGEKVSEVRIFELKPLDKARIPASLENKVTITNSYEEAFNGTDIFITATVSSKPYINLQPLPGSLHLNVSLRDYDSSFKKYVDLMIVDDWTEVCREDTDIERMHVHEGLQEKDTVNLVDLFFGEKEIHFEQSNVVMFNPMGMAIFDIAIGSYFFKKANHLEIGMSLEN